MGKEQSQQAHIEGKSLSICILNRKRLVEDLPKTVKTVTVDLPKTAQLAPLTVLWVGHYFLSLGRGRKKGQLRTVSKLSFKDTLRQWFQNCESGPTSGSQVNFQMGHKAPSHTDQKVGRDAGKGEGCEALLLESRL